jgi:hypothetical protein
MKQAGDVSHFSNSHQQLWYSSGLLLGQAFAQVKAYMTDKGTNLADVPALITVLETAFEDPDRMATVE